MPEQVSVSQDVRPFGYSLKRSVVGSYERYTFGLLIILHIDSQNDCTNL